MRRSLLVAIAVTAVLLVSAQSWAHHAFSAEFDANKPVEAARQCHQDGLDQSSCLAPYRRERKRRRCELDDRARTTECLAQARAGPNSRFPSARKLSSMAIRPKTARSELMVATSLCRMGASCSRDLQTPERRARLRRSNQGETTPGPLLSRRRGGRRPGWCGQAIPVPFPVSCSSIRIEFNTSSRLSKTALFSNRVTRIPSSLR